MNSNLYITFRQTGPGKERRREGQGRNNTSTAFASLLPSFLFDFLLTSFVLLVTPSSSLTYLLHTPPSSLHPHHLTLTEDDCHCCCSPSLGRLDLADRLLDRARRQPPPHQGPHLRHPLGPPGDHRHQALRHAKVKEP